MPWLDEVKERAANPQNVSGMQVNHTLTAMRIANERLFNDRAKLLRLAEYVRHKSSCPLAIHEAFRSVKAQHCLCGLTALLESDDA